MKTTIFILLLMTSHTLMGQANWSVEPEIDFDRYTLYEGKINDRYPIIMRLEESYESCNENWSRWTPRKVYGWYIYEKIGKKIPLVGHVCYADACNSYMKLFVPEDPINYSFNVECDLLGAKEIFTQERDQDILTWQSKDGEKYPVNLKVKHEFSWLTSAKIVLKINGLDIETFDLTRIAENKYIEDITIMVKKKIKEEYHLIFSYNHQSNPGSFGHGSCGAGLEEFIAHLVIDNNFEVKSFEKIPVQSCINNIYDVKVLYDENKPELGIQKTN